MIENWLTEKDIDFEVIEHDEAFTAQKTAHAEHVSGHRFAKTVIVTDGENHYMLVLPASRHVNLEKAMDVIGKPVMMASEAQMKELFGDCELGAEPPFGSRYGMPTYADASLAEVPFIVFRAGTHTKSIKMDFGDYRKLENPVTGDFSAGQ